MKTKTTVGILLATLLVPIVQVHALDLKATTSANVAGPRVEMRQEIKTEKTDMREGIKEENKEKMTKFRADIKVKVEAMRAAIKSARTTRLNEKAKARVEVRLNTIYEHLTKRVERLTKVDAEITTRLASRTDTAVALSLQTEAQTALLKAKLDIEATKAASSAELNATTSKDILRDLVRSSETSIKAATESYRKVVEVLKTLPKAEVRADAVINN